MGKMRDNARNEPSEERRLESSLRTRFAVYVICLICALTACALMLLTVTGALDPASRSIEQSLDHQLDSTASVLGDDIDEAAANGIALSRQLSGIIEDHLRSQGIAFSHISNDIAQIEKIQDLTFDALRSSMQATACSGAFLLLDATVNDSLEQAGRSGLHLRYVSLGTQHASTGRICMYRGASSVARAHNVNLNSSWQLETAHGTFPQFESMLGTKVENLAQSYFVTETYELPGTWENARFICVPVLDASGTAIGTCGFEMSDLLFQLSYQTVDATHPYNACALLDSSGPVTKGCVAGSQSGYAPNVAGTFSISMSEGLSLIESEGSAFMGSMRELPESRSGHVVAVLMPRDHYDALADESQRKIILSLIITLVVALGASWLAGKRYVAPMATRLVHLRQLHERERAEAESRIDMLAGQRRDEMHPHDLEGFRAGLATLTPKERAIYDMHAAGLSTSEILKRAEINQNTLKYHNRNIYVKLGVSSRKQLQLLATIIEREG